MDLFKLALGLLDSIDDVVVITNLKGAIIFANRRAEELAGCLREEMAGRSLSAYWVVAEVPWKRIFETVLETAEIEEFDGELVDREGARRVFRMRAIPLRDTGLKTTAIGFTGRDITHLSDLEVELGERRQTLESRIREVDALVSALSHDLRTPLISIQGFVNLVVKKYRDRMDAKGVEYLDRLKQEADRMDRLVQDLPRAGQVERQDGTPE